MRTRLLTCAFVAAAFPWLAVALPGKAPHVDGRFAVADLGTGWDSANTAAGNALPNSLTGDRVFSL